jgi:hypothetical protein
VAVESSATAVAAAETALPALSVSPQAMVADIAAAAPAIARMRRRTSSVGAERAAERSSKRQPPGLRRTA